MALFPITGRFVGDFVPHLVAVDTEDTFDQIGAKVAVHSVGRRLPGRERGRTAYEVSFDGEVLPGEATLASLMARRPVLPLQWFDVRWKE